MVHVPYKGAAPAITALIGGEVQVFTGDLPAMLPFVSQGREDPRRQRRRTVSRRCPTSRRPPSWDLPNVRVESNYGIVAPTGTPAAITQKLHDALVKVVGHPRRAQATRLAGRRRR